VYQQESEGSSSSAPDDNSSGNVHDVCLLTRGRAWAVSLALRDRLSEEFLAASFQGISSGDFLYRLVIVVIAVFEAPVVEVEVDLKTFASWEDSPEKMMMDMVSDPNKVRREDR
ncbi:hypothetical protein BHE74_00045344, partial [Ensete ventricosum]